jgi:hypothetical protein
MNDGVMSELGQTRRFRDVRGLSDLPPTSDVSRSDRHFAFVPKAEVVRWAIGLQHDALPSSTSAAYSAVSGSLSRQVGAVW